ncbi:hypothetical protein [Clostridium botulinum]|uniref:hypothetical protein n=1 Tax=Clostridium botulinum TaxID=1491 RepID=UPI0004D44FFD|nr:hypothetical protein Z953_01925 [Clostridium botulinum D str. 16868]
MKEMEFLKVLLPMFLVVIVILIVYNVLKIYLLDNIKINKWVVLIITAVVFVVPNLLWGKKIQGSMWQYVHTGVFLILFLWFLDVAGLNSRSKINKREELNKGTIRAKAKPSRVNKTNIEVIPETKKVKKKIKKK